MDTLNKCYLSPKGWWKAYKKVYKPHES